ncbi:DUF7210 family protein [Aggregatibacter kilianii]|uniref:DUF7210 family protein n=1 Tax=Aggregatibacter kilianii TaxID=2025884 RepID=UPI000D65B1B5|nr:hypothetical protein [Aggregatibacter kilianii]DAW69278.1 MAG TPA: hypothetical protein [Caudoviricetes sp.]
MKQIKLNQPHVHAGISYATGDVIEVTDADAAYLILHQIGVSGKSAVKKSDESDEQVASEQSAQSEQQPGDNAENPPSADGETENQNQGEQ